MEYGRMGYFIRTLRCLVYLTASLILTSSPAFAGEWWSVGSYIGTTPMQAAQANCAENSFCIEVCSIIPNTANSVYARYDSTGGSKTCSDGGQYPGDTYFTVLRQTGTCPASIPYQWPDGSCNSTEACPVGTTDIGTGGVQDCAEICPSGYTNAQYVKMSDFDKNIVSSIGCGRQFLAGQSLNNANCTTMSGELYCAAKFVNTGDFVETHPCNGSVSYCYTTEGGNTVDDFDEQNAQPIPDPTEQETYSKTPTQTTNNPDGSVTDEYTETTTQSEGQHTTVETVGDTIVVKDATGTIIEIIKQNTFNTYTDGSAQEVVETTTNYTPSTDNNTVINTTNNNITNNTNYSGITGSTTTTKTTDYNSNGGVTSSSTTTSGNTADASTQGDGTGDGEGGGSSFCEYAETVCDFIEWFKGEDFEEPEHQELPYEEVDVSTMQSDWTSGLGSGSCPTGLSIAMPNEKSYTMDYTNACNAASTIFKPILLFFALLAAAYIVAGVRR